MLTYIKFDSDCNLNQDDDEETYSDLFDEKMTQDEPDVNDNDRLRPVIAC
jgi:hypothetical protein